MFYWNIDKFLYILEVGVCGEMGVGEDGGWVVVR